MTEDLNVVPSSVRVQGTHHNTEASKLRTWAVSENDFPYEYVETHGLANYSTFVGLLSHFESRTIAGATFANRNDGNSAALHGSATIFETKDSDAGYVVRGTRQ